MAFTFSNKSMNKKILLITLLPIVSIFAEPTETTPADETILDQQEIVFDLVERVKELERKVEFLDKQIEVTSSQAFEKYGLYVVRPGDTLFKIAKKYDLEMKEIMNLNPGINPIIEVAQIIRIKKEKS